MKAAGYGASIVTSSSAARGASQPAAYIAAKWGLIGLVKGTALELAEHRITVNAICRRRSPPTSSSTSRPTDLLSDIENPSREDFEQRLKEHAHA